MVREDTNQGEEREKRLLLPNAFGIAMTKKKVENGVIATVLPKQSSLMYGS
jgi:hypothetical protein